MSDRKQVWVARLLLMCIPAVFLYWMSQISIYTRVTLFGHVHNVLELLCTIFIWTALIVVGALLAITLLVNGLALLGWFTQWIVKAGAGKTSQIVSWNSWGWPGWPVKIKSKSVDKDIPIEAPPYERGW